MIKVPSIRGSAQARLLLYRLMSHRLSDAEQQLLNTEPSLWEKLLEALERSMASDGDDKTIQTVLGEAFSHIDRSTKDGLQKQIGRLTGQSVWMGVFPSGLLESFMAEHMKLIKGLQREHLDKVSLALQRGIRQGRLHKDMAKDIRQMTDMSKRRARLIARNAPLQYSGELTRHHQMSAGIKSYRWQTSGDERVRKSHNDREKKVYSWDGSGPHPRSEVQCRCDAVPVMSERQIMIEKKI
jgi:SPP1 gp7 family putative phage head morphogenesis protein